MKVTSVKTFVDMAKMGCSVRSMLKLTKLTLNFYISPKMSLKSNDINDGQVGLQNMPFLAFSGCG